jgi:heat shock protein HslJ
VSRGSSAFSLGYLLCPCPDDFTACPWPLEAVQTAEGSVLWTPLPGHFLMTFGAHSVTGSAQCNSFQGAVHVTPLIARLSFRSVLSTAMLCGLEAEKEEMFFAALATAAKYQVQAERLSIYFEGSTKVSEL